MKRRTVPVDIPAPTTSPAPSKHYEQPAPAWVMELASSAFDGAGDSPWWCERIQSLNSIELVQLAVMLSARIQADGRLISMMRAIAAARLSAYSVHHAGPHCGSTADGSLGGGWTP